MNDKPASLKILIASLVKQVQNGRPVVPLLGAGISIAAGVPRLSEVTEYLAKTKAYIRHKVYSKISPSLVAPYTYSEYTEWQAILGMPAFRSHPQDFLREFGWPDPQELESDLRHWTLLRKQAGLPLNNLSILVNAEILDALAKIDRDLISNLLSSHKRSKASKGNAVETSAAVSEIETQVQKLEARGTYWKILLSELTRSSSDLVDTLFQRLTKNRQPSETHRFFAMLTPILRIRLFLTTNFDTLLEDALRAEGLRPTVFEVPEGLALPHPKLIREDLSVVKLHGGAHGLLVGDRLDSPIDEVTRERFRASLPSSPILLVMGMGGGDQRVLDMIELIEHCSGKVYWLHFENRLPEPLTERFSIHGRLPSWFKAAQIQDPCAFLRAIYSEYTQSNPSASVPFSAIHPIPVIPRTERPKDWEDDQGKIVIFANEKEGLGLGATGELARFVASRASTHRAIWIDAVSKYNVENVISDILLQLRRYDPGLPPEIVMIESPMTTTNLGMGVTDFDHSKRDGKFSKVVRRLYAALARGRYLLAIAAADSFGRMPLTHHIYSSDGPGGKSREILRSSQSHNERNKEVARNRILFAEFLETLLQYSLPVFDKASLLILGRKDLCCENLILCLGLQDSIIALSLDEPNEGRSHESVQFTARLKSLLRGGNHASALSEPRMIERHWRSSIKWIPVERTSSDSWLSMLSSLRSKGAESLLNYRCLAIMCTFRRRRSACAVSQILMKYGDAADIDQQFLQGAAPLRDLMIELESKEYWIPRGIKNEIYNILRHAADSGDRPAATSSVIARIILACSHAEIATLYLREMYAGSQDVLILLESFYHRISSLRHLQSLQEDAKNTGSVPGVHWLEEVFSSNLGSPDVKVASAPRRDCLDGFEISRYRVEGLRTLWSSLSEEKWALLERIPSSVLQIWCQSARSDELQFICSVDFVDNPEWRQEINLLEMRLRDLIELIEVEILRDRMADPELLLRRKQSLILEMSKTSTAVLPSGNGGTFQDLVASVLSNSELAWSKHCHALEAAMDFLVSAKKSPWIFKNFYKWGDSQGCPREVEKMTSSFLSPAINIASTGRISSARSKFMRIKAELELWGQSLWDAKGKTAGHRSKLRAKAERAIFYCSEGLSDLDSVKENSRSERSHLYSLKGRAMYLSERFSEAYRQFDLARAGLNESLSGDRDVLAIVLLRQADCLLLHADWEVTNSIYKTLEEQIFKGTSDLWSLSLSLEGMHKLDALETFSISDGELLNELTRDILSASLANVSPDVLEAIEARVRARPLDNFDWSNLIGVVQSRLFSAEDILSRAENILGHSRRRVEWWACLFQLKAQLSVENLLLLLAGGDIPARSASPEWRRGRYTSDTESHESWQQLRDWLYSEARRVYVDPGKSTSRVGRKFHLRIDDRVCSREAFGFESQLESDEDAWKLFVHRFRFILRKGLVAVRQGLDMLLPPERDRTRERLEGDPLVTRLLRLWVELMVCGAAAHAVAQTAKHRHTLDSRAWQQILDSEREEQWTEWLLVNQLAGLVHMPNVPQFKLWFWSWLGLEASAPGLAVRAQTLAAIDNLLRGEGDREPAVKLLVSRLLVQEHYSPLTYDAQGLA